MGEVDYKVALDPEKVHVLARIWRQETPEKLIQGLFELAYHTYVEEEDELIPGRVLRRKTEEMDRQLEVLKKRAATKTSTEKDAPLCPKCFSKPRYDTLSRDYACEKCGWEGPPEETVRAVKQS